MQEALLLPPNEGALAVVAGVAEAALARHPRMSEEEASSVQLVLTFLRNLLYVPEVQVRGTRHACVAHRWREGCHSPGQAGGVRAIRRNGSGKSGRLMCAAAGCGPQQPSGDARTPTTCKHTLTSRANGAQVTRAEEGGRSGYLQGVLFRTLFEADIMELMLVVAQHAGVRCPLVAASYVQRVPVCASARVCVRVCVCICLSVCA